MTSINLPSFATATLLEGLVGAQSRLRPGDVVAAIVLATLGKETLRLQLPDGILDVATKAMLAPGTQVEVTVGGTPARPTFVLNPVPQSAGANAQTPVASNMPQPPAAAAQGPADMAQAAPQASISQPPASPASSPQVGVPPLAAVDSQPSAALAAQPAIDVAPAPAAAVQKLAAAIIGDAAARQDSVAPLYADLAATFARPDVAIPSKVVAVVQQLFALRLDVGSKSAVEPGEIKAAVQRSGLLPEPQVATDPRPAAPPADLKSVLQSLRVALNEWLDGGAPELAAALVPQQPRAEQKAVQRSVPMPPFRNAPTSAQPAAAATIGGAMPMRDLVRQLLGETDAAIARQTLLQIASLSHDDKPDAGNAGVHADRMTFEIPLQTAHGTAVAQMRIERDAAGRGGETKGKMWRASFSIDIEPVGPVHATIALAAGRTAVTLKAERPASADCLSAGLPLLEAALRDAALEPGPLSCQAGTPLAQPAAPGLFLDRAT